MLMKGYQDAWEYMSRFQLDFEDASLCAERFSDYLISEVSEEEVHEYLIMEGRR